MNTTTAHWMKFYMLFTGAGLVIIAAAILGIRLGIALAGGLLS